MLSQSRSRFVKKRTIARTLGSAFVLLGFTLAVLFLVPAKINPNPDVWLRPEYYSQFLPIAVSVMLLVCGLFLALEHPKANFNLGVFGHTALEEALFDWVGLTSSALPAWAMWGFFLLAMLALGIAYSNLLEQKPLSAGEALFGIVFGAIVVLLPQIV